MWFLRLIQAIPAVIWSGMIGASLALLGTGLQNRAHRKLQTDHLSHDADQRRQEREMTLRRDVYLRAAAAIAQMQDYLGNFANLALSNEQHASRLAGSVAALSQVELVGSIETLRLLSAVRSCFYRRSLELIEKKLLAEQLASRINELKAVIQNNLQEQEQLSGILQSAIAAQEPRLRDSFVLRYEKITAAIQQESTTEHRLALEFADRQRDLILLAIDALTEMGTLIAPVVIEVRRELDFKIDADAYLRIANESDDLAKQRVAKMFEDLKDSAKHA